MEWAITSAVRGRAVLRDHDSLRAVLNTPALFQSSSSVADLVSGSSNFPPYQYQTQKNATSHGTHDYPPSCRPTVGSVPSDPCFVFDSRRHSDIASCCLSYQCQSLPRLVMHVRCTQCPLSASKLISVVRRCVWCSTSRTTSLNAFHPGVSSSSQRDSPCHGYSRS